MRRLVVGKLPAELGLQRIEPIGREPADEPLGQGTRDIRPFESVAETLVDIFVDPSFAVAIEPVTLSDIEDQRCVASDQAPRSEERRVGKEGVSTCSSRW